MNKEYIEIISKASKVEKEKVKRVIVSQYLLALLELANREKRFRTPFGVISMEIGRNREDPTAFTYLLSPTKEFEELSTGKISRNTLENLAKEYLSDS